MITLYLSFYDDRLVSLIWFLLFSLYLFSSYISPCASIVSALCVKVLSLPTCRKYYTLYSLYIFCWCCLVWPIVGWALSIQMHVHATQGLPEATFLVFPKWQCHLSFNSFGSCSCKTIIVCLSYWECPQATHIVVSFYPFFTILNFTSLYLFPSSPLC